MRKALVAGLVLGVVFVAGVVLPTRTVVVIAKEGKGAAAAAANGDVNGDSRRNITDVIYLLR